MNEVLPHLANLLILVSFSVRSVLGLRALNVVAGCFFIGYFLTMPTPGWAFIGWNVVFSSINIWHIRRIILERRPPVLSAEEQALYQAVFSELAPQGFRRLLDLGQWQDGVPPEVLIPSNTVPERMWVVAHGRLEVRREGLCVRCLEAGDFVGDTHFFTELPVDTEVVVSDQLRMIGWSCSELRRFVEDSGVDGAMLQKLLGQGLVRKMEASGL